MKYLLNIVALAAAVAALPTTIHSNYVVHEKRQHIRRARSNSNIDRRGTLPISIGLKQRNLESGEQYLMDVSHPESANYGQHWSPEKIADTFASDPASIDAVLSWLEESGISSDRIRIAKGQNWVRFNATINEAEDLLHTEYKVYNHPKTGKPILGCDHYSIPSFLVDHVDLITPTVHIGPSPIGLKKRAVTKPKKGTKHIKPNYVNRPPKAPKKEDETASVTSFSSFTNSSALSSCTDNTSIDCIRVLYNIPQGTSSLSSMGVMEFQSTFTQSDLDAFYSQLNNNNPPQGTAPLVASIDGGEAGAAGEDEGEATLDLAIAIPLVFPQQVTIYEVGAPGANQASFGNFLDALDSEICSEDADPTSTDCGDFNPTDVISISWGGEEAPAGDAYSIRQCDEFMKLGLRGVTVLVSSGDNGVADPGNCTAFQPQFPATCPYVTSVGGTTLTSADPPTLPEVAVNGFGSGGGFSNIFTIPSYQSSSVLNYLNSFPPPYSSAQFNNGGNARAYPDISANGQWFDLFVQGAESGSGGTSMSAPLAGSIFSLINEQLKAAGKPTVGFVNPVLYANPQAFNDIVTGFNNDVAAGVAAGCGTTGFEAQTGWDPVTGLGTPDYASLLDVFMGL